MIEKGEGGARTDGLGRELTDLWAASDRAAFWAVLSDRGRERLRADIMSACGLQHVDAEECVANAIESLLEQDPGAVTQPYAFLRACALNEVADWARRDARELVQGVQALPAGAAENDLVVDPGVDPEWAVIVLGEIVEDAEIEGSWAVRIVGLALPRVSRRQRQVLEYLSKRPFDYRRKDLQAVSEEAGAELGITAANFRRTKSDAYAALTKRIREAVQELGIHPPPRAEEAIFGRRHRSFPSRDDLPDDGGA